MGQFDGLNNLNCGGLNACFAGKITCSKNYASLPIEKREDFGRRQSV